MLKLTREIKEEIMSTLFDFLDKIENMERCVSFEEYLVVQRIINEFADKYPSIRFTITSGLEQGSHARPELRAVTVNVDHIYCKYEALKKYFPKVSLQDAANSTILHEIGHIETLVGELKNEEDTLISQIRSYLQTTKKVEIPTNLFKSFLEYRYKTEAEAWNYAISQEPNGISYLMSKICLHDYAEVYKEFFKTGEIPYTSVYTLVKAS